MRYVITLTWNRSNDKSGPYCKATTLDNRGELVTTARYLDHGTEIATENAAVAGLVKELRTFTHLEIVRT